MLKHHHNPEVCQNLWKFLLLLRKLFFRREKNGKCLQEAGSVTTRKNKNHEIIKICWCVPPPPPKKNKRCWDFALYEIQGFILFGPVCLLQALCPQVLGAKSNAQSWRHNAKQTTITFGKTDTKTSSEWPKQYEFHWNSKSPWWL